MPNSTESQCGMDPCPWVRSLAEIAKAGKGGEELRLRVVTSSLVLRSEEAKNSGHHEPMLI